MQQTPEWFSARLGRVGASRINDVVATLRSGGEASTRADYRYELMVERLTGMQAESFSSKDMQWGTDAEPLARSAYEATAGVLVKEVGFIHHPKIAMSGASPDGFVSTSGLVEIKCPKTKTHVSWMLAGLVPSEHQNQMLWQMACTGRDWCDFVSYDPRMPAYAQLFVKRFERDDERIAKLEKQVSDFLLEVDLLCTQVKTLEEV
jgi:putative phage-type endonuclease